MVRADTERVEMTLHINSTYIISQDLVSQDAECFDGEA